MIEIDGKILSEDILTEPFACDITKCKGICCIEGDSGAPLDMEEGDYLEEAYNAYKKYMTPEGIAAVEEQGFVVVDSDGDLTTPLVNGAECAFAYVDGDITLCAVEKAWLAGECSFRKPISCHLYPIRVLNFKNGGVGLNYHRWSVCGSACENGRKLGVPIYKSLKEPIIRRFGEEFYEALDGAAALLKK
ncbi:MAG: DUF3109 family protein [Rikenellaceae bacterium]